jgi:hypothetical protein
LKAALQRRIQSSSFKPRKSKKTFCRLGIVASPTPIFGILGASTSVISSDGKAFFRYEAAIQPAVPPPKITTFLIESDSWTLLLVLPISASVKLLLTRCLRRAPPRDAVLGIVPAPQIRDGRA